MADAAGIPELKPAGEQVFEHFYFAIQAALAGLGVVMGPLALVAEEVRDGRLIAPISGPLVPSRGYFVYAPAASNDAPAIVALRRWLIEAGRMTEAMLPGVPSMRPGSGVRPWVSRSPCFIRATTFVGAG